MIVECEIEGEVIGRLGAIGVGLLACGGEVKDAGVVAIIRITEYFAKPCIDVLAIRNAEQPVGWFDAAILADSKEKDAVDGSLDGEVEVFDGEVGIELVKFFGEGLAPGFDIVKKRFIERLRCLGSLLLSELVEGAAQNRFAREDGSDFVPALRVLLIIEIENDAGDFFGLAIWLEARVEDEEVAEVRENGKRQFR